MKQRLILIKFLPAHSILSTKKSWMITALVDPNKRQYEVLSMHEALYNTVNNCYYDNKNDFAVMFSKVITNARSQSTVLISVASWNSC